MAMAEPADRLYGKAPIALCNKDCLTSFLLRRPHYAEDYSRAIRTKVSGAVTVTEQRSSP